MNRSIRDLALHCLEDPSDNVAWSDFYTAFQPILLAVLVAVHPQDPSVAEDACQSAFAKFLSLFREKKERRVLDERYLVVIGKNCLSDELRRRKRDIPFDTLLQVDVASDRDDAGATEARLGLLQAVARLPRRCQYAIERYYVGGATVAMIGRALGVQAASVHVILQRCRDQLRVILNGR
jgi:RNA polymerase sigma factor (sigma-70 family)